MAANPSVDAAVAAVRDFLEMEVAFATEFVGDHQVFRKVSGDAASFGLEEGQSVLSSDLYCRRIIAGELPRLIADVRGHEAAAVLPVTDTLGIGAFVSVPINLSDGGIYGTLCAASHHSEPLLKDRDVQFLHVLARMIGDQVERERLAARTHQLEIQAAAVARSARPSPPATATPGLTRRRSSRSPSTSDASWASTMSSLPTSSARPYCTTSASSRFRTGSCTRPVRSTRRNGF